MCQYRALSGMHGQVQHTTAVGDHKQATALLQSFDRSVKLCSCGYKRHDSCT